jgi:hypothetical protein
MSTQNKQAIHKNPFVGWSTKDLSMASEEMVDIVDGLSDLAAVYTDNAETLKKANNLRRARIIRDALRLCRKYQRYLSDEVNDAATSAESPELVKVKYACTKTSETIEAELNALKEVLAEHKDSCPSPPPMITRMAAITAILGSAYAVEMYLMFGSVMTKPFNDSKLAKAIFAGTAGGVLYIGFKDKIDPFTQAAAEVLFGTDSTIAAPYLTTASRLDALSKTVTEKPVANDVQRPNNHEIVLRSRRDFLKLQFAPRR